MMIELKKNSPTLWKFLISLRSADAQVVPVFLSGTEGSQAWNEISLNRLIFGMRTADPLTVTFYRSKEDSQVPCFCPSSLTFVVAIYNLWLWK